MLPELRRFAFVIVDESHTLRNDTRRDYRAIQDYIHANDSRVLLLTATPYNIRFRDVANQLGLFIDDDNDLGISPTAALAADPQLADKVDGKITTMAAFRRSEEPDDWKRLMSEHLIRRTRTFIKANYARVDGVGNQYLEFADGQHFRFPERIAVPINHSFGEHDPASVMASQDTLAALAGLALPRYQLGTYINSGISITEEERRFIDNLSRGRGNVAWREREAHAARHAARINYHLPRPTDLRPDRRTLKQQLTRSAADHGVATEYARNGPRG